jgi:DNA polymerase elongation subunit (family B)
MPEIFTYAWFVDEEETDRTVIRIYGLDEDNKNFCLIIQNFESYVYLELPVNVDWTTNKIAIISSKIDSIMGDKKPTSKTLMYKEKLYYANVNPDMTYKKFPYLLLTFSHHLDYKKLYFILNKGLNVPGLCPGNNNLTFKMHEANANPILKLVSCRKLPTAGWISFTGLEVKNSKITTCDREFIVEWKNLKPISKTKSVNPLVMSYDLEVNSSDPNVFPCSEKPNDKIFQISCVFHRTGIEKEPEVFLLSLGKIKPNRIKNATVICYDDEIQLLLGYRNLIQQKNPNIIVGYNIMGFDIPYTLDRINLGYSNPDFFCQSFVKDKMDKVIDIKWSSSAYGEQVFKFLDVEGRIFVDLLPVIKRDHKLSNYKLSTVSTYFLKDTKKDLPAKGIFKCYRMGMVGDDKGSEALGICGEYCIQDTMLVTRLFEKLKIWVGLAEMATVCNVPIPVLYLQGQQIKVFSQIYKKCTHDNVVVENNVYITGDNEYYQGAKVFPPIPGLYDKVVPFDFASLYPTSIIAYNIDYHTYVKDDVSIPDDKCHIIEWDAHENCEHDPNIKRLNELNELLEKNRKYVSEIRNKRKKTKDVYEKEALAKEIIQNERFHEPLKKEKTELNKIKKKKVMCGHNRYRFLKEPIGVLPAILKNLLDSRSATKKELEETEKRLKSEKDHAVIKELELLSDVLDKRQLSFKVSANSGYGAMGVRKGFLPFMIGAMCTTAMGRKNITIVSETIPGKFKGQLVYGDTDSNYVAFPHLANSSAKEIWKYSEYVAKEVTKIFPPPISLAFEKKIYWNFLILRKKGYMSIESDKSGKLKEEISKKGVIIARRDNAEIIRDIYTKFIEKIFKIDPNIRSSNDEKKKKEVAEEIAYYLLTEINRLFQWYYPYKKFVTTQSVKRVGTDLKPIHYIDENNKEKGMIGDYKVDILPEDENLKEAKMLLKEADNEDDYYLKCLPAQAQLAHKLTMRGKPVETGTRLEYVVVDIDNIKAKKYEQIEEFEYFCENSSILRLDIFFYLEKMINPFDEVLNILFKNELGKDFISKQHKFRIRNRKNMIDQLKRCFAPKIVEMKEEECAESDQEYIFVIEED